MVYFAEMDAPVGRLLITADETCLTGLWMDQTASSDWVCKEDHLPIREAKAWLAAYFRGENPEVRIPLNPSGTPFQRQVWEILLTIPLGETRTYGSIAREMAHRLGKKKMSAQAVGQAVGRNPISILIPCHRVVGTDGALTGYASGLEKKRWLLRHEGWQLCNDKIQSKRSR